MPERGAWSTGCRNLFLKSFGPSCSDTRGAFLLIPRREWEEYIHPSFVVSKFWIFFLFLASINEWIRLTFFPEDWATAKIFMIITSVVFGSYQLTLTKREGLPNATAWGIVV
jgi:hypothetical protein